MAHPDWPPRPTLAQALAALRRDPLRPAHARVDEMELELRVVSELTPPPRLGDWLAAGGGWKGESSEEIVRFLREERLAGGTAELPRHL